MLFNHLGIIMIEKVFGIESDLLITRQTSDGFSLLPFSALESCIPFSELVVLTRPECEKDEKYRHFATYCIVEDEEGKILTYSRSKEGGESRLHGNWSIGIGGHIDAIDSKDEYSLLGILTNATLAELDEELYKGDSRVTDRYNFPNEMFSSIIHLTDVKDSYQFLFDDSNDVGKRHIGVVSRIRLSKEMISKFADTMESKGSKWLTLDELKVGEHKLENWSKILVDNYDQISGHGNAMLSSYGDKPFKNFK